MATQRTERVACEATTLDRSQKKIEDDLVASFSVRQALKEKMVILKMSGFTPY